MEENQNSDIASWCVTLTAAFITLKLFGFISWPWFWVLSPTIIPVIGVLTIIVASVIAYILSFIYHTLF